MKVQEFKATLYRLPLPTPIQAASTGVMTEFDLVMVQLTDSDGARGCGYTVMMAGQGQSIAVIANEVFKPMVHGHDPRRIEQLWAQMWRRHHYAGRGGPVSFAISAIDTALWDLRGNALGSPLWHLLGGANPTVRAYAGNIDLNFEIPQLLEGASRSLEAGFKSIKMRLGRPTLAEDLARVAAMRDHLGPDIELMADANEAWRVDQALRAMHGLREFDLIWLEEPIRPDDYAGYAHLRANGGVPLSSGENLHTLHEFTALISAGGVDFVEPDLTTCGGITPYMKVARLAEAHGLPVTSHGAHDVHIHLLAGAPNAAYLEVHGFGLEKFIEQPLEVIDGYATAPNRPGHGIAFDWDGMKPFQVT